MQHADFVILLENDKERTVRLVAVKTTFSGLSEQSAIYRLLTLVVISLMHLIFISIVFEISRGACMRTRLYY